MMFTATMTLLLLLAGLLQSLLPPLVWLGQAKAPVLMALAAYYAIAHGRLALLIVAAVAGLFQDSLSLLPMGCSTVCLAAIGLAIQSRRGIWFYETTGTAVALGFAGGALMTLAIYLLLLAGRDYAPAPAGWVAGKAFGAGLLGALVTPAVWMLAAWIERRLELRAKAEEGRTLYGGA